MHDLSLISTIAAGFTAAWLLGLLTQWLGLSPIVGYLLAGVLIGPHTPGFVGDQGIANQLAEVGVILLMFGVGLHFHMKDLMAVKRIAIPGAVGQSLLATVAAMGIFHLFGTPLSTGAVIGMAMAVASTVVLMRVLMDANVLSSPEGHVAVGWLIVEDIFTVILLVLIPVLGTAPAGDAHGHAVAESGPLWLTLGIALLKLGLLVFVVLWVGSRFIPKLLVKVAKLRSRELFTLTVLVFSVAVAAASYFFFGASMALGAFLAGMVVAQSSVSHQAAADALPLRDAFAVLFFVSVGMLFDPSFLVREPLMVLGALGVILIVKPLAALGIVAVMGYSARTSLTVALGLAQIGEFSFILSELARRYGLMTDEGHNVLVASAILSITLNPLMFRKLPDIERWLRSRPVLWSLLNRRAERRMAADTALRGSDSHGSEHPAKDFALLVGYGPVGRAVHRVLEESGLEVVMVDMNMETVRILREEGKHAIFGDASNGSILEEAGVAKASYLIVTVPDASQRAAVITAARGIHPDIKVVVRARYLREREELRKYGVNAAVFEEAEAAVALARVVLTAKGMHRDAARGRLQEIRFQLAVENLPELRGLTVGSVMVPWPRVRSLSTSMDRASAMSVVENESFRMFPVVSPDSGQPVGYVTSADLLGDAGAGDWTSLIRPIPSVSPDDSIADVFPRLNEAQDPVCLVRDASTVLGLVTRGHLLDRVEGDFSKGKPQTAPKLLGEAVARGGVLAELAASNREEAIRELVAAISPHMLPAGVEISQVCKQVMEREEEISTNLGNGIAVPHARIDGLARPLAVIGRSATGIVCSDRGETVRVFFLLVTPTEHPEMHLSLLSQVAKLVGKSGKREAILAANTPVDFLDAID